MGSNKVYWRTQLSLSSIFIESIRTEEKSCHIVISPPPPPQVQKYHLDHHFWTGQSECSSEFYFSVLFNFQYLRFSKSLLIYFSFRMFSLKQSITSDSIKYCALLVICNFGPLNKPISQAMYSFSYQYLTGVVSRIVINQKKKIKSVHQDHGCSNCFRSKVHWNRYTVLYILVYILSLIY